MEDDKIRSTVRDAYAKVAKRDTESLKVIPVSACCGSSRDRAYAISRAIGYGEDELASVPEGANLGLGCGNPTALAALNKGSTLKQS